MRTAFLFLFAFILFPRSGFALESEAVSADHASVKLLSGVQGTAGIDSFEGALLLELDEGWHAYWRSPGDSGLAPVFDWSGSKNVSDVALSWPTPKRFDEYGLQVFGYGGRQIFPLAVSLEEPGKEATLSATISVLVCHDICIPQNLNVSLDIPADEAAASDAISSIEHGKTKIPALDNIPALKIENVTAGPKGVVVDAYSEKGFLSTDLFVELKDSALTAKPKITVDAQDQRNAQIMVAAPENIENFFDMVKGQEITLTLTNGTDAVERRIGF